MIDPSISVMTDRAEIVRDFASSELFDRTFQDGMELVEDAAVYLDGPGRQDSKLLARTAALLYAGESMRLTTRLMQVASWLLVQRAVREGDMSASEACQDRYRVGARPPVAPTAGEAGIKPAAQASETAVGAELPNGLVDLVRRSERLYERVVHLDRRMYLEPAVSQGLHPVAAQIDRLRQAFGGVN